MVRVPILLALLTAAAPASEPDATAARTVPLEYRVHYRWDWTMPAERFAPVRMALPVGAGFAVRKEANGLRVDADGDGRPELAVAADPSGEQRARVVRLRRDGRTRAVRLVGGKRWTFAASGSCAGEVDGVPVRLFDLNGNGRHGDFGEDAMIVGHGRAACFLSRVASIGGRLYELSVAPDDGRLSLEPWKGERGVLDLRSGFETTGRLLSGVVRSRDGRFSFELASHAEGVAVPAGTYELVTAVVGHGRARARIEPGAMPPIEVAPGGTAAPAWGGPLRMEFTFTRRGDMVVFRPADVAYVGRAGERYVDWFPLGASPEFVLRDADTGDKVAGAHFAPC